MVACSESRAAPICPPRADGRAAAQAAGAVAARRAEALASAGHDVDRRGDPAHARASRMTMRPAPAPNVEARAALVRRRRAASTAQPPSADDREHPAARHGRRAGAGSSARRPRPARAGSPGRRETGLERVRGRPPKVIGRCSGPIRPPVPKPRRAADLPPLVVRWRRRKVPRAWPPASTGSARSCSQRTSLGIARGAIVRASRRARRRSRQTSTTTGRSIGRRRRRS
jgi:hypothetical protein